jgi:hypothetical protein
MFTAFLMWFPPCAMFVAVAWVTELAWRAEDHWTKCRTIRRILGADTRPDFPRLLPFEKAPLPWKQESWFSLTEVAEKTR